MYIMCMGGISEKNIITGHSAKCFSSFPYALFDFWPFDSPDYFGEWKRKKGGDQKKKTAENLAFTYSHTAGWTAGHWGS